MKKEVKKARAKAKNIIQKAFKERNKLLSESALMEAMRIEAEKIKQKIIEDCTKLKQLAKEENQKDE